MRALLLLAASLGLVTAASADECIPSTSDPTLTIPVADVLGIKYVVNDLCQPDCLFSIWFYFETNQMDGLQRWDDVVDDTCGGMIEPDQFLW